MEIQNDNLSSECGNNNCILNTLCFHNKIDTTPVVKTTDYFRPKQDIFFENNSVKGIYFILKGVVKVYKNNSNKDQIVRLSTKGEVLGHRGIGKDKYPVSAQALTETELCFIEKEDFFELLNTSAPLATNLMLFFAGELNSEETKLSDLINYSVLEKGKMAIKIMIDSFGVSNEKRINYSELLSRKEIGELVGLTANQITKILKELQEDNLISIDGKIISIQSIDAF